MDFPYKNYLDCTYLNVVQCAPWDNWCVDSLKFMVNRLADLDDTVETKDCKICKMVNIQYDYSPSFKLPKACS